MKIDIFSHILPKKYLDSIRRKAKKGANIAELGSWTETNAALSQMDIRLRLMDRYPGLETIAAPEDTVELAHIANDEMAELVTKYPDKFLAAIACLPLNNIDATLKEADRAITQLNFRGVQIFTNINGEPLDSPKFKPLYELMTQHDLPIWIHPWDPVIMHSSTNSLPESIQDWVKRLRTGSLIWPFETSVAMIRLVQSGIFEDYPKIKFITHHCGGMVPFFERRVRLPALKKFYNDTALYGNSAALKCGYSYFGVDRLLFATDMPLGTGRQGYGHTLETIRSVEEMDISDVDKKKIFEENAKTLLRLLL
jgi:predicted TIM-barrel fold metal-dependent hydrolase